LKTLSDEQLIDLVRSEDNAAFAELYDRYKERVYAYCYRLLQNESDAEDAVHNVFFKALQSLRTLDDSTLFRYWLFMIARNEVYDTIRKHRRNGRVPLSDEHEELWEEETQFEKLERKELSELVQHGLSCLKTEYREVLTLRVYEHFSYAEIAAITGDTESSVKSRLHKARRSLAEKLEPFLKEC
jgi:RNA polymerase sigma-70 factor (ECF subfamily)